VGPCRDGVGLENPPNARLSGLGDRSEFAETAAWLAVAGQPPSCAASNCRQSSRHCGDCRLCAAADVARRIWFWGNGRHRRAFKVKMKLALRGSPWH